MRQRDVGEWARLSQRRQSGDHLPHRRCRMVSNLGRRSIVRSRKPKTIRQRAIVSMISFAWMRPLDLTSGKFGPIMPRRQVAAMHAHAYTEDGHRRSAGVPEDLELDARAGAITKLRCRPGADTSRRLAERRVLGGWAFARSEDVP